MTQDKEISLERCAEFPDFYLYAIGFAPVRVCPDARFKDLYAGCVRNEEYSGRDFDHNRYNYPMERQQNSKISQLLPLIFH